MNETERKELTSGFDVQTADLSGRWLVEASAGTGKTFALERIVLRLVIEEAVSIDRILVVTFTNAATAELRERVRALFYKDAAFGGENRITGLRPRKTGQPRCARVEAAAGPDGPGLARVLSGTG